MIECENNYCIYWKNKKCSLSKIFINSVGVCADCILIHLSEKELQKKRKAMLERFDKLDCKKYF